VNEAFIYVGTNLIKEGKIDDAKRIARELVELAEAKEPRLVAFHFFIDETNRKLVTAQVHRDASSMNTHMEVISEHRDRV